MFALYLTIAEDLVYGGHGCYSSVKFVAWDMVLYMWGHIYLWFDHIHLCTVRGNCHLYMQLKFGLVFEHKQTMPTLHRCIQVRIQWLYALQWISICLYLAVRFGHRIRISMLGWERRP